MLTHNIDPDPPTAEERHLDLVAEEVERLHHMLGGYVQKGFTHDSDYDADTVSLTLGFHLDARCPLFELELRLKSLAAYVEAWRKKHDAK